MAFIERVCGSWSSTFIRGQRMNVELSVLFNFIFPVFHLIMQLITLYQEWGMGPP